MPPKETRLVNLLLAVIYVAFISLGLPDAVLGAAWPTMSADLGAPVSWAGGISMVISAGTIVSALMSDRMTLRFGAGKVTAISVALTALALFGFSMAPSYWVLILFAVPYGLGAGGVDAALNNYVAIHYESHHMSWLHAMWGIGALTGPYIMGYALNAGQGWSWGYRYISILQVLAIRGAREILIMFFCYCALEQTAMLWASSYMALGKGIDKTTAAMWASLFCIGITVGRLLSGFVTMKFNDPTMIRMGQVLVLLGVVVMLLPLPQHLGTIVGLMVVGLGCAPIYPCVIHSTPTYFGEDKSQAIVGMQMACAYVGSMCMPPVFGLIAQHVTIILFPWYLVVFLVLMIVMHESLRRKCGGQRIG